jgi:hypothetical protein
MTQEESANLPLDIETIDWSERPYALSPWPWQFSKHPIHVGSRVERNLMYYGPPNAKRRRNEIMNWVAAVIAHFIAKVKNRQDTLDPGWNAT